MLTSAWLFCLPLSTVSASALQNELSILEFIHNLVETLDKYFENVCELDLMFNLERAHFILDEMLMSGRIVELNKGNILKPIRAFDMLEAADKK